MTYLPVSTDREAESLLFIREIFQENHPSKPSAPKRADIIHRKSKSGPSAVEVATCLRWWNAYVVRAILEVPHLATGLTFKTSELSDRSLHL